MKKIMLTLRSGGENGGPYISHSRIMSSSLNNQYCFEPLYIPRSRVLLTPWGMHALVNSIRRSNPDIVQIAGLQLEGFMSMVACKLAGVKTVLAIHGSSMEAEHLNVFRIFLIKCLERWTVKSADMVYGVSDYVCGWNICRKAKQHYGTIYNMPSKPKTDLDRDSVRKKMGIDKEDIVISSTGRIVREKGYDILWNAIRLLGKRPQVKFCIAGDGAFREEWQQQIIQEGYSESVHLLGYQNEVDELLVASDIFIMCTHHETLCISLLEAAMYGLPLIASDVGGIPEIIEHNKNGYLIRNKDVEAFANALNTLIADSAERKRMGYMAWETVSEKFNSVEICAKLDKMYQEVLSSCVRE